MTASSKGISILLLMTNTLTAERWSGIHRVAIELARNLGGHARLDLVKWDEQDGQLRFADTADFDRTFGPGQRPPGVEPRRTAHKVRYRFGDEIIHDRPCWLLNPEISYHAPNGNEILARIITQCREYGVNTASIFYDLIPITNSDYREFRAPHDAYISESFRVDVMIPISAHSASEVSRFYRKRAPSVRQPHIVPILLPELQAGKSVDLREGSAAVRNTIMMVGTVEPRKQQVEFLRAFLAASRRSSAVAALRLFVAGSLHPAVADAFRTLLEQLPNCDYADYASQTLIEDEYKRALFSAFVSNDEGFGLPIAESLAHGVPCLCADFGSMAEIGAGGGCLTVDVNSSLAIENGIVKLAEDNFLHDKLVRQIATRKFRNWDNYAADVAACLGAFNSMPAAALNVQQISRDDLTSTACDGLVYWAAADVLSFSDEKLREEFVGLAALCKHDSLLPTKLVTAETLAAAVYEVGAARSRSQAIAALERDYGRVRAAALKTEQQRPRFLRILISTYNRAAFVHENVRWLLETVASPGSDIQLVVVDNASTDQSCSLLNQFVGHPNFELIRNTANVGMLGNLKICSTLPGSEYVWIIGDDDFIVPQEVSNIINALRGSPGVPLAVVNFGVYHRFALSANDTAAGCIAECAPLAREPVSSGLMPLNIAGAQHDNLFTAIYPIIWRADVLGACFNYPFTGDPFSNLVESVPTSKLLLESYSEVEVYWHAPISIVGNAHNSWSSHRPRWHGRLMPEVFELAKLGGIDPRKLYSWSRTHADLFLEAVSIAHDMGVPINISSDELDVAWRVFRRRFCLHLERELSREAIKQV